MSHRATNWAFEQRGLKPATKLVLLCLADRHNPDYGCFPAQETLANDTEMSRSALNEHLKTLEAAGLIRREQRRSGRTHRQVSTRYVLAFEFETPPQDHEKPCTDSGHGNKADSVSGNAEKPCPDSAESRVRNPDTNPVREPVKKPVKEREGAQARVGGETENQDIETTETPGRADFDRRVQAYVSGKGFDAGKWPDWESSSIGWITRQFASLTREERAEAERWRDAYLLDLAARKKRPVPVGTFMRDRQWQALDPEILALAEKRKAAALSPDERPKPDGWAACLGPVGMAWLFAKLLDGPKDVPEAAGPFVLRYQVERAWPAVAHFQTVRGQRGGAEWADRWHKLKSDMEPVPQGSDVLAAWRAEFEARRWPWLPEFDQADVVYCPKGGPGGLKEFNEAVRRTAGGANQEAAE